MQGYAADISNAGLWNEALLSEMPDDEYVKVGVFADLHANFLGFVVKLATCIQYIVDELEIQLRLSLIVDFCIVYMTACAGISIIVVKGNCQNCAEADPDKFLPTVFPVLFVKLSPRTLVNALRAMSSPLEKKYSAELIEVIWDEHKELVLPYNEHLMIKTAIDGVKAHPSFHHAWAPLAKSFPDL